MRHLAAGIDVVWTAFTTPAHFFVTGTGAGRHREGGPFRFALNDLFTVRGSRIAEIDSHVVPPG